VADASEPLPGEDSAPDGASPLEDIEQDLNTVDEALAALDSGDLEEAESLAAQLASPGVGLSEGDEPGGDDQRPASGSAC